MTIRLLLIDDHILFRQGLRQLCEYNGGFEVVGEASSGHEAVRLAKELDPDVILMDIRLADVTGIEAARLILQSRPQARVIMLTMYHQEHYVRDAFDAGACGYLLKTSDEATVFSAIRAARAGQAWIDPQVAPALLNEFARRLNSPLEPQLNRQDTEILRLVAHGMSNEEIAEQLFLSKGTVSNRLRQIFATINVQNRTEAALYALRRGIASLEEE
jgi:two-component system, NarL family, response regulator LiaR